MVEACSAYGRQDRSKRVSVGNLNERGHRSRWEDNIKMDVVQAGWGTWTGLIWLRIWTEGGLF